MKPLLSAPLTFEDLDIWFAVIRRFRPLTLAPVAVSRESIAADRRDAELMLWAQQSPQARFISTPVGAHWVVSMVAFASLVYRWRLVRCGRDPFYPNQPDITNCA